MSTATQIDTRQLLIINLENTLDTYVKDFGYLPQDKLDACPMGKARTPLDFTVECAGFNLLVAAMIGEAGAMPGSEERKAYLASLDSGEKAMTGLKESVAKITASLKAASDEDLLREVAMPWGSTSKVHEAVHMATVHMAYHLGHINYIQSLYGDDQMHWAE